MANPVTDDGIDSPDVIDGTYEIEPTRTVEETAKELGVPGPGPALHHRQEEP